MVEFQLGTLMASRAETKIQHETAVINAALAEHNRIHGRSLIVIGCPDPPDAIVSDSRSTTWLEATDAFFSSEWAKDLFSFAASEPHEPMQECRYMEPDARTASQLLRSFDSKSG